MWGEALWESCQQGTAVGDEGLACPEAARVKVEVESQKRRCPIEFECRMRGYGVFLNSSCDVMVTVSADILRFCVEGIRSCWCVNASRRRQHFDGVYHMAV